MREIVRLSVSDIDALDIDGAIERQREAILRKHSQSRARVTCTTCGCEIPPGKAGRKCKDCREGRIKTEFPGRESPIVADIRAALNAIQERAEKPPTSATAIVPAWLIEKLQQQYGDQWEAFLREQLGDATMFTTPVRAGDVVGHLDGCKAVAIPAESHESMTICRIGDAT